jgi:hypothetical protein
MLTDEFGHEFAAVLVRDLALAEFSDKTAEKAIADGEDPRQVWVAICRAQNVPKSRWHGIAKKPIRTTD